MNGDTWRKVDELSAAYSRLADQRAALWSTMVRYRMTGSEQPAAMTEGKLLLLDRQGLALAERIETLCQAAVCEPAEETPLF